MLKRRTVDVIVPVHDAFEELGACLQSVQQHGGDYRLVLIDDGSTDERIGALFRQLSAAKSPRVVLLRNERPLGFAATANRGMAFSRNDVVLLDSNTEVTTGWLDKIRQCAASDPGIGTVTPLSSDAGIGSAPSSVGATPEPSMPNSPTARWSWRPCRFIRISRPPSAPACTSAVASYER